MSAATAVPLVNGFMTAVPSTIIDEAAEYEKILKLRDEVFAGIHPRLTVPAHAIKKVSPVPTVQPPSASHTNVPPPFLPTPQQPHLPGLSLNNEEIGQSQSSHKSIESVAVPQPKPTASGIDPVLLTKSEDLVRAETQLHRQRLEKALRDQFEQKRLDARKRPAPGEAKPDFDVTAVLAKALEVVNPESAPKVSTPQDDGSVSESYDENSLYSSRAPDSTPEAGELEDNPSLQNQGPFTEGTGANGVAEVQARSSHQFPPAVHPHQINPRADFGRPTSSSGFAYPNSSSRDYLDAPDRTTGENDDDEEEGEYSPPEAMEQPATPRDPGSHVVDPRTRPLRRYSELEETGKRPGSPNGGNVRIVRNHITSPIAPQPSRVSPLAVAKQSLILQNSRGRNGRTQRGRDDSPEPSGQALPPRKKRKLDRKAEKRRRLGRGSPDVKDEPVSPPPFHEVQPLGSGKTRSVADGRPIVIEDTPAQEIRYVRATDRYLDSPLRPASRHAEPIMPLSEPRILSRTSMRPPQEPDLRRVASMHNMRIEQPREYYEPVYDSPVRPRATSYVRVDSPVRAEPPRQVTEMPMAYEHGSVVYERGPEQEPRAVRTPAPTYREVYQEAQPEIRYVPEPMPPPQVGRIVVDEYGRRFREIIQERPPVPSRAASTYVEREQPTYYENYDHGRAGSAVIETRPDGRAPDPRFDMPPPRTATRDVAYADARLGGSEARFAQDMPPPSRAMSRDVTYGSVHREMYEPVAVGRGGSHLESGTRQPMYVVDQGEYREPVRMASVRPPTAQYERMLPRASSIPPPVREGSVFMEERSQLRREYDPREIPQQYRLVRPEVQPRYVDADGREVMLDARVNEIASGGQRYV